MALIGSIKIESTTILQYFLTKKNNNIATLRNALIIFKISIQSNVQ